MDVPSAIITGITGQDGSYLRDLLLRKGYQVHGFLNPRRVLGVQPAIQGVQYHLADFRNLDLLRQLIVAIHPREVYHLAAQSSGESSFHAPLVTAEINGIGTLRLLEAVRRGEAETGQQIRFFHASSGEMFGPNQHGPHTESSLFCPQNPYGTAKVFAHFSVINYRDAYGLHASNGILFNHESPRRGEAFVTRKITLGAARIAHGIQQQLALGTLESQRDWGYAGDYVEGMWKMLQQEEPDDYILATGEAHSVGEFAERAFQAAGLDHQKHIVTDEKFLRPNEVDCLQGDASKARIKLGWQPRVGFSELVRLMVEADLQRVAAEVRGPYRQAG